MICAVHRRWCRCRCLCWKALSVSCLTEPSLVLWGTPAFTHVISKNVCCEKTPKSKISISSWLTEHSHFYLSLLINIRYMCVGSCVYWALRSRLSSSVFACEDINKHWCAISNTTARSRLRFHTRGLANSGGIDPRALWAAKWQNTISVMVSEGREDFGLGGWTVSPHAIARASFRFLPSWDRLRADRPRIFLTHLLQDGMTSSSFNLQSREGGPTHGLGT